MNLYRYFFIVFYAISAHGAYGGYANAILAMQKEGFLPKEFVLPAHIARTATVVQYCECGILERHCTTLGALVECKAMNAVGAKNLFEEQQSSLKNEGHLVLNVENRSSPLMRIANFLTHKGKS